MVNDPWKVPCSWLPPQDSVFFKTWFPSQWWVPSPTFVAGDKFSGNYWRFVAQPSSLEMIRAMNIKKFWYSSSKFIAQPHELSLMSEIMWGLSMLQVIFIYIFITWNNIFHLEKKCAKRKYLEKWRKLKI